MESTSIVAILIFIGILAFLSFFYLKLGKFGFWKLANKLPEEFMEFAQTNDHIWIISNSSIDGIGSEYTGPFKFVAFGNIFTLYALADDIENSQAEFVAMYQDRIPKLGFPIPSLLALIYPIAAMATYPAGEVIEVLGYGFSNLGYLLLAALIPGSFRIFGMDHRLQIFIGALIFWGIGVALVNI